MPVERRKAPLVAVVVLMQVLVLRKVRRALVYGVVREVPIGVLQVLLVRAVGLGGEAGQALAVDVRAEGVVLRDEDVDPEVELEALDEQRVVHVARHHRGARGKVLDLPKEIDAPAASRVCRLHNPEAAVEFVLLHEGLHLLRQDVRLRKEVKRLFAEVLRHVAEVRVHGVLPSQRRGPGEVVHALVLVDFRPGGVLHAGARPLHAPVGVVRLAEAVGEEGVVHHGRQHPVHAEAGRRAVPRPVVGPLWGALVAFLPDLRRHKLERRRVYPAVAQDSQDVLKTLLPCGVVLLCLRPRALGPVVVALAVVAGHVAPGAGPRRMHRVTLRTAPRSASAMPKLSCTANEAAHTLPVWAVPGLRQDAGAKAHARLHRRVTTSILPPTAP
mmetsp:Transcript_24968/g.71638  ORF Transcript_24968/g.71638 Transcript_24968/m.71638 type:complete len:385 (+) Transcript_24968:1608-2762(+)